MKMNKITMCATLFAVVVSASQALAQPFKRQPIETVQAVSDRVISKTPFRFRAILAKPEAYFRGIHVINFERTWGLQGPGTAYAYGVIDSERDARLPIEVTHNDGLKIWLNGQPVYEKAGTGKAKVTEEERDIFLSDRFEASVRIGKNMILIKSETAGEEWKVYLRPRYPAVEEGKPQDDQWMTLTASNIPDVTPEVGALSRWLIIGPFPNPTQSGVRAGLSTPYPPEREFRLGIAYHEGGKPIAWEIPKVEIYADVIDAHPLWGTLYDWNYHTAGLVWAIRQIGEFTSQQKYIDHMARYCDFMLDIKPYVAHEKFTLNRPYSRHTHMWDTPLLDFTTAPTLPFIYRLLKDQDFPRKAEYQEQVDLITQYVMHEQIRLPDGTFTRETPFKYTTWVDDMFMGIPYLLYAAQLTKDPAEKQQFFNDAAQQVIGFHKQVYDPAKNLYVHARYSENPGAKLPYWSRANGWGIWAVTEVLLHLPKNHPLYRQILTIYRNHVKGIVAMQNPETGFYHNVLDRRDSFKEASGTAIFTMAIARGINQGWIPRGTYEQYAIRGWQALETVIDENGRVTDICMGTMCTEDVQYYFDRPVVEDDSHGLLGVVVGGIEMQKMIQSRKK